MHAPGYDIPLGQDKTTFREHMGASQQPQPTLINQKLIIIDNLVHEDVLRALLIEWQSVYNP